MFVSSPEDPVFPGFRGHAGGWVMVLHFQRNSQDNSQDGRSWGMQQRTPRFLWIFPFLEEKAGGGEGRLSEMEEEIPDPQGAGMLGSRSWSRRGIANSPTFWDEAFLLPAGWNFGLSQNSRAEREGGAAILHLLPGFGNLGGSQVGSPPSLGFLLGSEAQRAAQRFDKNGKNAWIFPFSGEFSPSAPTPGHSPGSGGGAQADLKTNEFFPFFPHFSKGKSSAVPLAQHLHWSRGFLGKEPKSRGCQDFCGGKGAPSLTCSVL